MSSQKNAPFGSSQSRFDPNYDCKMLFDRSPGPGSYKTAKDYHDFSELGDLETDTLISLAELKRKLNTESSMLDTMNLKEHIQALSKIQQIYNSNQRNRNQITLEGPGFSKAPRFLPNITTTQQTPGPGYYATE